MNSRVGEATWSEMADEDLWLYANETRNLQIWIQRSRDIIHIDIWLNHDSNSEIMWVVSSTDFYFIENWEVYVQMLASFSPNFFIGLNNLESYFQNDFEIGKIDSRKFNKLF